MQYRPASWTLVRWTSPVDSVPHPIQTHSKPWQHGTSSDLSCRPKGHCGGASISHYWRTEQMQNLDWNKCFQRVSDAGLHFPLCSPSSAWHVFVFPLSDHPGRLGRHVVLQQQQQQQWVCSRTGVALGSGISITAAHRLDSRPDFNEFEMNWRRTRQFEWRMFFS